MNQIVKGMHPYSYLYMDMSSYYVRLKNNTVVLSKLKMALSDDQETLPKNKTIHIQLTDLMKCYKEKYTNMYLPNKEKWIPLFDALIEDLAKR